MESVYKKTLAEYEDLKKTEQTARSFRQGEWPEYSEYTDKFLMNSGTEVTLSPLEQKKRYSESAKSLRQQPDIQPNTCLSASGERSQVPMRQ